MADEKEGRNVNKRRERNGKYRTEEKMRNIRRKTNE